MAETLSGRGGVVVPIQGRRVVVPEQISRLAQAVADCGLGARFCFWQRQDTETWQAAGRLLARGGLR